MTGRRLRHIPPGRMFRPDETGPPQDLPQSWRRPGFAACRSRVAQRFAWQGILRCSRSARESRGRAIRTEMRNANRAFVSSPTKACGCLQSRRPAPVPVRAKPGGFPADTDPDHGATGHRVTTAKVAGACEVGGRAPRCIMAAAMPVSRCLGATGMGQALIRPRGRAATVRRCKSPLSGNKKGIAGLCPCRCPG